MQATLRLSCATILCATFLAQSSHAQPTITTNPQATALYVGRTASFTVGATDTNSFTYQWMAGPNTNSLTNLPNGGNISGVMTSNLVITGITTNDAADYVVVLTDTISSTTSTVVALTVVPTPTDVYGSNVLMDNPVGYWRLNDANTNLPGTLLNNIVAYDYQGGYNGKYTNMYLNQPGISSFTAPICAQAPGTYGDAVYIPMTNNPALYPSNFSVEVWCKEVETNFAGNLGYGNGSAVPMGGRSTVSNGWFFTVLGDTGYKNNVSSFEMEIPSAAPLTFAYADGPYTSNAWQYLVGTYNASTSNMTYYVNGQLGAVTANVPFSPNSNAPVAIGQLSSVGNDGGAPFNGYLSDAAMYNYVLSPYQIANHYAEATTGAALAPPVITQNPQSVTIPAGGTASFTVEASSPFSPLNYQWQAESNGAYVNLANGGNISGVTTSNLTITNVASANATNYQVIVSYSGQDPVTSSSALLTIIAGPTITSQPQSTNVYAGQTATFTVGVSFAYPMTYQWQMESNGVYVNLTNGGNISGATNASLAITNDTLANATNYQVVISYPGISSLTSSAAALGVAPPLPIGLNCSFTAGVLTLNWSNSMFVLEQATNVAGPWQTNTSASGIQISPTNAAMFYRLVALYTIWSGPPAVPVITQAPLSLNLYAGEPASFSVQASFALSLTNLSYQWMAGTTGSGVYTNLANVGNISGVTTTNLDITDITTNNAADYVVVVSYLGISVTSTVATLAVQPAPAEMLTDGSLDGPYSGQAANGWTLNPYSGASMAGSADTMNTYGGNTNCQQLVVSGMGGAAGAWFYQPFTCQNGHVYHASIWMRASAPNLQVQFAMREVDLYDTQGACHILNIGTNWQEVEMTGGWGADTNCQLGVFFLTNGTFWLADASLEDVTLDYQQAPLADTSTTMPATLFGLMVNKQDWPPIQQGMMRLIGDGMWWYEIEKSRANFTWTVFDSWVNWITNNNPNCQIIYVMGQTPSWATAGGITSAPTNIVDWSNYVWNVGTRYKGIIHNYEIWNETESVCCFYSGTIPQMVAMATMAINVLTNIDPTINIIGPNVTSAGIPWLEQYIQAGGPLPNTISFHNYPTSTPENSMPVIAGFRDMLSRYPAFSSLPLWHTEGAPQNGANNQQDMGIAARCYLFWWMQNIPTFNWYTWDIQVANPGVTNVALSVNPPSEVPAPAGIAYSNLVNWLVGAKMTGKAVDTNSTWMVQIQQPGAATSHILWNPIGPANYDVPAAWNVTQQVDLSNNVTPFTNGNLTVGLEPVLLKSQ